MKNTASVRLIYLSNTCKLVENELLFKKKKNCWILHTHFYHRNNNYETKIVRTWKLINFWHKLRESQIGWLKVVISMWRFNYINELTVVPKQMVSRIVFGRHCSVGFIVNFIRSGSTSCNLLLSEPWPPNII